jgi:tRNA(Ile)-lysidine synthase
MKASRMSDPVLEKALTAISRYNMLAPGARVVAAVSGGPDSVCLFHVLRELAPRLCFAVAGIAHLNHKLRGEASDQDEHFTATLAAEYGVAFYGSEVEVAGMGGNLEQDARRARLGFFQSLIEQRQCDAVATGHTRDDQAETVLFRLLRGSGLAGLAGILPVTREGLIRPLLAVTRAEVEEFLKTRGIAWREDASNCDDGFARNRIRHTLLPALVRDWNPEISPALARLADTALEEEQWWESEIERLAARLLVSEKGGWETSAAEVATLPRAVARRLIRLAAGRMGQSFDLDAVERVLDLAGRTAGRGTLDLPGLRVVRSFDRMRFMPPGQAVRPEPLPLSIPGHYAWPGGSTRVCVEVAESEPVPGGCARLKLSEAASSTPLLLRGWRAGDHYHPAGHFRDRKIKEMFQQARVPSWQRGFWPILCKGSEILWTRQFGAADEWAANQPGPALFVWEEPAEEKKHNA